MLLKSDHTIRGYKFQQNHQSGLEVYGLGYKKRRKKFYAAKINQNTDYDDFNALIPITVS